MANKRERLEFEGRVVDSNKGKFTVKELTADGLAIGDDVSVLCTLSGKIRMNGVKILLGDIVRIEVSQYDMTQGRITYRIKGS